MTNVVETGQFEKPTRASLEPLSRLVRHDLDRVNATILQYMQSSVQFIPEIAGHLIAAGGKRLRPMLTLGSALLCSYTGDRHVRLAACVEFIHTATLLHDDVVDASGFRRGRASANSLWGNQASVLVGDFLFSRAFQLMVADGSLRILAILSGASAIIAEGEVQQLITTNDTETTEAAYLEIVHAKTAALFAAAARVSAVVAGRPEAEEIALHDYGTNLGIAFQLVDDVLDYAEPQPELGKAVGDDFREGKITLPVILAYRRGSESERGFWRRTLGDREQETGDLEQAQALMRRHEALADTVARARCYAACASDALGVFGDGEAKRALLEAAEFCVQRHH